MKSQDDIFLLQQLRHGNQEAFELLYKKYYKLLSIEAYYILKDEMDAEDTVQVFFIDFWEKQLFNTITSSLKGYFQVAIRNRCFKKIAHEQRQQKHIDNYTYVVNLADYPFDEPPEDIHTGQILVDMPVQRLQAFTLVHYENKKYKDAALEMGISVNSLKTHLKLAIKSLKSRFKNVR